MTSVPRLVACAQKPSSVVWLRDDGMEPLRFTPMLKLLIMNSRRAAWRNHLLGESKCAISSLSDSFVRSNFDPSLTLRVDVPALAAEPLTLNPEPFAAMR